MSLEHITHPGIPERQTSEWQNGTIVGWIPAKISKIESSSDPEGLGRVRVQCDLISRSSDLPNGWDGWVWVLEESVVNGAQGGAHRPLNVGAQVALLPMFGNPKYMLMLGAIHSRVDRPNPIFDRSEQVSGTQSANQVFSIRDDKNQERTDAYPNGVTQQVSRTGDVIQQTRDGARLQLQQDGTTRMENANAATVISKEGDVVSSSAGDVFSKLGADGQAVIKSGQFESALLLGEAISEVLGPAPTLTGLLKKAEKKLGFLGKARGLLKDIEKIADGVRQGDAASLAIAASETLLKLEGLPDAIAQGSEILSQIQGLGPEALGDALADQAEAVLGAGLDTLAPELGQLLTAKAPLDQINTLLSDRGLPALPTDAADILDRLSHSPTQQLEYALDQVLPGGYGAIANVSALGLADKLGPIGELVTQAGAIATSGLTPEAIALQLAQNTGLYQQLTDLLPSEIQGFIGEDFQEQFLDGSLTPQTAATQILGATAQGFVGKALADLAGSGAIAAALPQVQAVTKAIALGQDLAPALAPLTAAIPGLDSAIAAAGDDPTKLLQAAIAPIGKDLGKSLDQSLGSLNQSIASIGAQAARAKLQVNSVTSSIQAALGKNRVYANEGGAGFATPWGGFGFDKAGGIMNAIAPIAMRVLGSGAGGLRLDPKEGAALEGFDPDGKLPLSAVRATGDVAEIEAGGHKIVVKPSGVFIDGRRLDDLFNLRSQLDALEARLLAVEANLTPPAL